jgi:hypothetical protein
MAIKTFTTGEVLTASDTNTYLANSGLQYVDGATFAGAASFDVTGFTSDYLFYELRISVAAASGTSVTGVLFSGATARATNYYGATFFAGYLSTTGIQAARNNAVNFYLGDATTSPASLFTLCVRGVGNGVWATTIHGFESNNTRMLTGGYSNYNATNSFDKIRFSGSANLNGSWSLMGVRKP